MARGWESKAVEDQIEEGNRRVDEALKVSVTAEMRARSLRVESLKLSRVRLLEQLERARHPSHREVLMNGLRAIEKELEENPPEPLPGS